MTDSVIVALDLGTTGNRAIAFDKEGNAVASSYYEFKQHFPHPGWVEHDAEEILTTTRQALEDVVKEIGTRPIKAIGITNQRETTVLWDKVTGKPLHYAIVWQCRRTADRCEELNEHASLIKEKTGLFLDPYFSASKIEWLITHVPEVKQAVGEKRALFGTIDTWILYQLTHGTSHFTDVSNASRTMLFNIHTLSWDEDLLDLFQIPKHLLPEVKASDACFGHIQINGKDVPIHALIGDQQASLFAHCGDDTTALKNTYGTGLFLMANTGNTPIHTQKLVSTIAWQMNGQTSYALEGSIFTGGSIIQWLRDGLNLIESAAESEPLATSLPSNDDVFLVPALTGLGAPYWEPNARGVLFGLTRGTTRAHLMRSALESLTYQTRDIIDELQAVTHTNFDTLIADGGAVKNKFLMQTQANVISKTVLIPLVTESTAFGAAAMAGIATEFWTMEDIKNINGITHSYHPDNQAQSIEHSYLKWQKAVKLTIEWGKD